MIDRHYSIALDAFDPLRLYLGLGGRGPGFFESPGAPSRIGHLSIVPLRCSDTWRLDEQGLYWRHGDGREQTLRDDPLAILGEILRQRQVRARTAPVPFVGGFFGFFSYDLAGWIEALPRRAHRDLKVPALWLRWVDTAAIYDHHQRLLTLVTLDPGCDLPRLGGDVLAALAAPLPPATALAASSPRARLSPQDFEAMVDRAKEYIAAGDIYQANLSCRFESQSRLPSWQLYARLRQLNPSPFSCYLNSGEAEIISCSPERLVSLRGHLAEARPIAGTAPRGYTPPEDARLGRELLAHPKEQAEHVMLLDLERNDLGKVCVAGSVRVDEFMVLEHYSHVTHIVSNVRGELVPELGPFELLRAMFPGGTITGAPKKRCMEIIDELEPVGRGIYTGSAGYISACGDMDLNILIRSFYREGDRLYFQTGAGIVADSVPEREWRECLAKGEALRLALKGEQ